MHKILSIFLFFIFGIFNICLADTTTDCMRKISANPDFQNTLINTVFAGQTSLTDEIVQQAKSKILATTAATMFVTCPNDVSLLAKQQNGKIWLTINNQKYGIVFKMSDLFAYTNIRVGILVSNNRTLGPGDTINQSSVTNVYWSDACSDHIIWDNLDDDASINVAGQQVFTQYGGKENEFFLDFQEGNNRRAFPGLVLMDDTWSTSESIVSFTDLPTAIATAQQLSEALKNSRCSQQNLAVYVVALDTQQIETDGHGAWGYGAGVAGTTALIAAGLAATTTPVSLALIGVLTVMSVPAWIALGGVVGTVGAVISLIPSEIELLEQVIVLDGPYIIP